MTTKRKAFLLLLLVVVTLAMFGCDDVTEFGESVNRQIKDSPGLPQFGDALDISAKLEQVAEQVFK